MTHAPSGDDAAASAARPKKPKQADKCFVIMPFGQKPLNDGTDRKYDFDKVYRVIIRRAIQQAGLEPIRADEHKGSRLIHTDMFKDLRDQPVVVADLSLYNPNVFYELGIRHVLSSRGTVLICRKGTELPFDVRLSRVIMYEFDGLHLDFEVVEETVKDLKAALQRAKYDQEPDSPVHALLTDVLPRDTSGRQTGVDLLESAGADESLDPFHHLVAEYWLKQKTKLSELRTRYGQSIFGTRALGHYCLHRKPIPDETRAIADDLYDKEQYALANALFDRLEKAKKLGFGGLLRYASSLTEEKPRASSADKAAAYQAQAWKQLEPELKKPKRSPESIVKAAQYHDAVAGMHAWRWQRLSGSSEDLLTAIDNYNKAEACFNEAAAMGEDYSVGRLARVHLRLLMLLRARDNDPDREDTEGHRDAILEFHPSEEGPKVQPTELSWLRWYQAIVLADANDAKGTEAKAYDAWARDGEIMNQPGCGVVGRRQYTNLRRFLDNHRSMLRNPSLIARISQLLMKPRLGRV